jgi:hypothetical protein
MRHRFRRRPQVESLEALTLLSGASAAVGSIPLAMTSHLLHVSGTVTGTYHAREIPDAGKTYDFSGRGRLSPLGHMVMNGSVQLPGLLISPITGTTPTSPEAFGEVVLTRPGGSLTLTLSAPSSDNATTLPDVFRYQVARASGQFKGDTGSGQLKIAVNPAPSTSSAAPSLANEHGTFTLVFIPKPPSIGNTGS